MKSVAEYVGPVFSFRFESQEELFYCHVAKFQLQLVLVNLMKCMTFLHPFFYLSLSLIASHSRPKIICMQFQVQMLET